MIKLNQFWSNFMLISFIFNVIRCELKWVKNEFKVLIENEDCFFQEVDEGSVLVTSFQVIKGDDITFTLGYPNGTVDKHLERVAHGAQQIQNATKGDYSICFDNSYSHITSKLVSVYILTFHEQDLMRKFEHDNLLNETVSFARKAADNITLNLIEIYTHQAMERFKQAKDEYILVSNNEMVFYWSIFQSILIVCCGIFQVYFIKRLFSVSASSKNFR